MEPLFGFVLFFGLTVIATVVASKRASRGTLTFVLCCLVGFVSVPITVRISGNSFTAGLVAMLVPCIALIWAALTSSSEERAVAGGSYGAFKKCPYCAESVRAEAIKCKHCGSNLNGE